MLHHEDRVPHVAQTLQGCDQADVVPLVEADGRLVEDVEDPDQPRSDLRSQPNPLALTTGEASRRTLQGQVVHPDIQQKAEPQPDLLHHPLRHMEFLRREWNRREKVETLPDRKAADLADVFPAHSHGQTLLLQACTQTGRAFPEIDVARKIHPDGIRHRFLVTPVKLVEHPLKGTGVKITPSTPVGMETDLLLSGTVQQEIPDLRRQLLKRGVDVEAVMACKRVDHLEVLERMASRPGNNRPLADGDPKIGDDELLVEEGPCAKPAAVRAGPIGTVEGEHPRGKIRDADTAIRAGISLAEKHLLPAGQTHTHETLGKPRGHFQGVAQALPDPLLDHETVDDHVDVVAFVLVDADLFGELPDLPVHADANVSLLQKRFQLLLELPLFPPGNRCKDRHAGVRRIGEDRLQHHVDRLGLNLFPALGAVWNADPGEEKPEMVIDLGDRPHGGAGVVGGRALFDRDRRGEPLDRLHIRLVHLTDELPGVGGERLHIAPLPLGVDRIESERGLP